MGRMSGADKGRAYFRGSELFRDSIREDGPMKTSLLSVSFLIGGVLAMGVAVPNLAAAKVHDPTLDFGCVAPRHMDIIHRSERWGMNTRSYNERWVP